MRRIERRAPVPWGKTCAFTGHRPNKYPYLSDENSPEYRRALSELEKEADKAVEEGFTHFVCGGALGADTLAAKLFLRKREANKELTLEIVAPCDGQDKFWPESDRRVYRDILEKADVVTWVSEDYTPFCIRERNCFMVELAERLIAFYDGTKGGTRMTVQFALEKGIEVRIVKP